MAIANLIMQKKGGVGKSVTAALLYQALLEVGLTVEGVDTDPSNQSLAGYKDLNVTSLHILNDMEDVDKTLFDALIESICELPKNAHVVVDNGSSNYVALRSYMKLSGIPQLLAEMGHEVRIHVVIAGGPDLVHTCTGLKELAVDFPETKLVPWLNPFNGDIKTDDGKPFEIFKVAQEYGNQFMSVVEIPKICQADLFRKDLQTHFGNKQTFREAIKSSSRVSIVSKQRLKMFWRETQEAIAKAGLLDLKPSHKKHGNGKDSAARAEASQVNEASPGLPG